MEGTRFSPDQSDEYGANAGAGSPLTRPVSMFTNDDPFGLGGVADAVSRPVTPQSRSYSAGGITYSTGAPLPAKKKRRRRWPYALLLLILLLLLLHGGQSSLPIIGGGTSSGPNGSTNRGTNGSTNGSTSLVLADPAVAGAPVETYHLHTSARLTLGGNAAPKTHYRYQWLRCGSSGGGCHAVAGARQSSYRLTVNDIGHRLRVHVKAHSASGSRSALSRPSKPVIALPPTIEVPPKIIGGENSAVLRVDGGVWRSSIAATSWSFQWFSCPRTLPSTLPPDPVPYRLRVSPHGVKSPLAWFASIGCSPIGSALPGAANWTIPAYSHTYALGVTAHNSSGFAIWVTHDFFALAQHATVPPTTASSVQPRRVAYTH